MLAPSTEHDARLLAQETASNPPTGGKAQPTSYRRFLLVAKVLLAAVLLVWLVQSGKLSVDRLLQIRLHGSFALFVVLLLFVLALPALRWWSLLRIQKIQVSLARVTSLTWAGYFAALYLPGAAGGDLARAILVLRDSPNARARALSTVLADRFLGLYSLVLMGGLALVWLAATGHAGYASLAMSGSISSLFFGLTVLAFGLLWKPTRRLMLWIMPIAWRQAWQESFDYYRQNPAGLLGCLVISVASNCGTFIAFVFAGKMLGDTIPFSSAFVAGPLICLANCLPLTPGGIGVAETVSQELFARLGTNSGAEVMAIFRIVGAMLTLPGLTVMFQSREIQVPVTQHLVP